jgi:HSP20 family protein
MELVRWNPARELFGTGSRHNSLFDDFFSPALRGASRSWEPRVDIFEEKENIVVKAELPGMTKTDITIDVKDGVLTLKGERSDEKEIKEGSYFRRETCSGSFQRAFSLPENVNPEVIHAEYKDGVLKVRIPKPEEKKPRQITVH